MKLKPCRICGRTNMRIKTAVIADVDLICVVCKCGERSNVYSYNADEIDQTLHQIAVEIWNNHPHYSERTDQDEKGAK